MHYVYHIEIDKTRGNPHMATIVTETFTITLSMLIADGGETPSIIDDDDLVAVEDLSKSLTRTGRVVEVSVVDS